MKQFLLNLLFIVFFPITIWAQNTERNLSSEHWILKSTNNYNFKWLEAKVPGTVHTDLYQNKIIPNPFFGVIEKNLQWIENEEWHYETLFAISEKELKNENCFLQFDGLDTYAEVWFNRTKILTADNMFRTWKVDVKKLLVKGENQLRINFMSAVKKGKEAAKKLPYILPGDEKVFTRKAQSQPY